MIGKAPTRYELRVGPWRERSHRGVGQRLNEEDDVSWVFPSVLLLTKV